MPQQRKSALKKALSHPCIFCSLSLFLAGPATADTLPPQSTQNNCETVSVDYFDNPELTRTEKLALMEKAFYASLLKFEDCSINSSQSSSGGGSNDSDGASSASGTESASSEGLQGTEPEESVEQTSASSDTTQEIESESSTNGPNSSSNSNGKIPEDIPLADNDDVLAAQIRAAAEAETDPETREKLWNEYRKYKGMSSE